MSYAAQRNQGGVNTNPQPWQTNNPQYGGISNLGMSNGGIPQGSNATTFGLPAEYDFSPSPGLSNPAQGGGYGNLANIGLGGGAANPGINLGGNPMLNGHNDGFDPLDLTAGGPPPIDTQNQGFFGGMSTAGKMGSVMGGVQSAVGLYSGIQNLGMAKKMMKEQQKNNAFNRKMSLNTYNQGLENRMNLTYGGDADNKEIQAERAKIESQYKIK